MTYKNQYADAQRMRERVLQKRHREYVGGLWEELGRFQLEQLVRHGLLPEHTLLDIGCGCLRGGVHFVRYLHAGGYYGHDLHPELIESGLAEELAPLGLSVPREHFQSNADFDFSGFPVSFDFALAQSLFSHLPFNDIRLCLARLAPCMRSGGRVYATFFALPEDQPLAQAFQQPHGPKTLPHQDPYHYYPQDMEYACRALPWRCAYLGDVGHPRGQHALLFVKH
jgi:SAM-dependent methyltransferase